MAGGDFFPRDWSLDPERAGLGETQLWQVNPTMVRTDRHVEGDHEECNGVIVHAPSLSNGLIDLYVPERTFVERRAFDLYRVAAIVSRDLEPGDLEVSSIARECDAVRVVLVVGDEDMIPVIDRPVCGHG